MIKRICVSLLLVMLLMIPASYSSAADYGSGNYVSSAPVKPTTGLKFYMDYTAITTYGSGPFVTAAFDWNGNYQAHVAQVSMYPASQPTDYFVINAGTMEYNHPGETFYYMQSGRLIDTSQPMDSLSIYRCSIRINSDPSVFYNDQTYLEKVIRHEIGHVFLLKHPTLPYYSVMNQGVPNSSSVSATVTVMDRNNLIQKWGQ